MEDQGIFGMRKYTEKTHAERVLKMMEKPDPCGYCPQMGLQIKYEDEDDWKRDKWENEEEACRICLEFIGLEFFTLDPVCPCNYYLEDSTITKQEIWKRTWLALEEKGYI